METTLEREVEAPAQRKRSVGWALGSLVALAVAAVAVATVMTVSPRPAVGPAEQARPADAGLYTADEEAVMRLVSQGLIPAKTLEGGVFLIKSLVNRDLIPAETLKPYQAPVQPLWCPQERALMAAVAAGLVPQEALQGEPFRTKRLIAKGLIPRQSATPC
ncbi:MAG TPA: hypothetical protein VEO00_06195 [Actinomycetota bacterium]|nr:hypothetical protein [Actinomycetota bacterium]